MSFSFTNPRPDHEPSFSFTGPADVEEQLQAITDMALEILRLVAEVRRQINN
ncbi:MULTISPECIES: hypothetical protein [unclassified Streptomyces]|uniref:hypothetical protein n=1 Tax=unclassified Streptomyces TaxID=2593676 RepID=UPI002E815731|nr:hypothetical protein [Streptomyces sp. NBC_00539]WUC65515.1 hypothetical protein OG861_15445 [Streptomyces sp. NBC_00539]